MHIPKLQMNKIAQYTPKTGQQTGFGVHDEILDKKITGVLGYCFLDSSKSNWNKSRHKLKIDSQSGPN